jgi:hypothetical protein
VCGNLRREPHAVQQERHPTQRVADVEQPGDQIRHPRQRPPLILGIAVRRRPLLQRNSQPIQPCLIQSARRTTRPLRRQRRPPTSNPASTPPIHRVTDTRNRAATCATGTFSANQSAARIRTASRLALPSADNPLPSAYLIIPA